MKRLAATVSLVALAFVWRAMPALAGPPVAGGRLHIVPDHVRVSPGERARLRAEPPADPNGSGLPGNFKSFWAVEEGLGSIDHDTGLYEAPYLVPPAGARVHIRLRRFLKPLPLDSAETWIELAPGAWPGAEDCLGSGQSWGSSGRALEYQRLDELPFPIVKPAADYPASARARGITGSLVVNALVCRSGRVIDAYPNWPVGATPDRFLEQAAVEAAARWVFSPGRMNGEAMASWIAIPFRFPQP